MNFLAWREIFEANASELFEILRRERKMQSAQRIYAQGMSAYLLGDASALADAFAEAQNLYRSTFTGENKDPSQGLSDEYLVQLALDLRLGIRKHSIAEGKFHEAEKSFAKISDEWKGEIAFLLGMAEEIRAHDAFAADWYKRAEHWFLEMGAEKKAVKALGNYVAAQGRTRSDGRFFIEYQAVFKQAMRVGEKGVAATALTNLSREYQKLGAYRTALKAANRALAVVRDEIGSLHYELLLAHRAHLLLELGRVLEADADLEQILLSTYPEVKEAVALLQKKMSKADFSLAGKNSAVANDSKNDSPRLTKTWKERSQENGRSGTRLAELEDQFIQVLMKHKSLDKTSFVEALYGKSLDFSTAEARFKNLLVRMRKKFPGLLILADGKYRLADQAMLPEKYLFPNKKKSA